MPRSTKAERERRLEELSALLLDGLGLREIRHYLATSSTWGAQISDSQLKRYLKSVRARHREAARIDREKEVGAAKLRLERTMARASAKGDLRNYLCASKQLAELLGLNAPTRSDALISIERIETAISEMEAEIARNERHARQ